jgi:hypothetical protein
VRIRQNAYRKPSSTWRGRLIWVTGTTPNSDEDGSGSGAELGGAWEEKNAVRVPLELGPYESKFIVVGPALCIIPSGDPK